MNRLFFSVSHKVSSGPYAGGIPLTAFFYSLMTGWMQHMARPCRSDTSQSFKILPESRDMVSDRFFYSTILKAFPMKPHFTALSIFLLAACQQNTNLVPHMNTDPQAAIRAALPSTEISHIDCEKISGLCEVVTDKNIFYATPDGRYLLVGRVFDVEGLEDLTEPMLLRLDPDRMIAGAVGNKTGSIAGNRQQAISAPPSLQKITWSDLPKDSAVIWGKIGARKLAVFSDPKCPYCRKLSAALEDMNVEVHEYFVNFLGSRSLSAAILCAEDQNAMRRSVFKGEIPAAVSPDCDTAALDLNDRFAAAHRIQGTPLLISADGRVLPGFAGRQQLLVWLGEEAAVEISEEKSGETP